MLAPCDAHRRKCNRRAAESAEMDAEKTAEEPLTTDFTDLKMLVLNLRNL